MKKKRSSGKVRQIRGDEDFAALFGAQPGDEPAPEEDFAALLEQDLSGRDPRELRQEKPDEQSAPRPETAREFMQQAPPPQDEIDLHGCTAAQARERTEWFLQAATGRGLETVRIIVGRGIHSAGRAVLPDTVEQVLAEKKRQGRVRTFCWERGGKRSSGALLAFLSGAGTRSNEP